MTEDFNPYAVLRVSTHATLADINHAFRARLRDLHPDTRHHESGGTAGDTKLQQLIAAYHLLRNPQNRAQHDRKAADGPITIPVTHGRSRAPAPGHPLWAGPVRRHR